MQYNPTPAGVCSTLLLSFASAAAACDTACGACHVPRASSQLGNRYWLGLSRQYLGANYTFVDGSSPPQVRALLAAGLVMQHQMGSVWKC